MAIKGKRVLISLLNSIYDLMPLQKNCFFKLIDAKIVPILLYGSEIWGLQRHECIERVHTYACKRFLSVPQFTCNVPVMGDCRRFPLHIYACKRAVRYWIRIINMPNHRYVYKCYIMLKSLDSVGYINWVTHLKRHLQANGFGYVWESQSIPNIKCFMSEYVHRLQDQYIQIWSSYCVNSSKLQCYSVFKQNFVTEPYANFLTIRKFRSIYARFRASSHNLAIERGRYENIDRNARVCKHCNHSVETEYHFLLVCPLYVDLRQQYIDSKFSINPNLDKFNSLMSCNNESIVKDTAQYLYYAFERRHRTFE